jgi:dihydropteroate synthase
MKPAPLIWTCRDCRLRPDLAPLIMGILNVTPDSFSDGGRHADAGPATEHALRMVEDGADIIDVGGESTRPGAAEVPAEEELRRILPVVTALAAQTKTPISVDTRKPGVARAALDAGASIVNDITALQAPGMAGLIRESGAGAILMHMLGTPATMQQNPVYTDVVAEVGLFLQARIDTLTQREGVDRQCLAVDPGIGFGKTAEHNWQLLNGLEKLVAPGIPVVVGVSRKRFLGLATGRQDTDARLAASLAALICALGKGARILRVHDVRESRDAVRVWQAFSGAPAKS